MASKQKAAWHHNGQLSSSASVDGGVASEWPAGHHTPSPGLLSFWALLCYRWLKGDVLKCVCVRIHAHT